VQHGQLMGTAVGLGSSLEALAALAAHLRVERERMDADPRVRELLRAIAQELLGAEADAGEAEADAVVGMTRTLLAQSAELVADPARAPGWEHVDPQILQGTGKMSMAIAGAIGAAADRELDGLGERLAAPGAALLDVGTGSGWLAIALAQAHPELRVVGIDLYEPSLELARGNVADAGFAKRIELRAQDVTQLADAAAYDAVWLPLPFLPRVIVQQAMTVAVPALRPGGWLIAGTYPGPPDRLSQLLVDLRTVRSGGHAWATDELVREIASHGLADAQETERTWTGPVRLFAGRRPG
jgi:2-polyprenyl-3-methyl-5-hydroxy-6-metoxy-1,4-benzoquinol methylase